MLGRVSIFYFSGTGNARNVSRWMKKSAESRGISTELIDISQLEKRRVGEIGSEETLGFISPTHGFNYPPVVLHFILRFPRTKSKNKVFLMNTRAGTKLGRLFVPGLSGIALLLSSLILLLKGYKVIGLAAIDLPSNWISLHPGLNDSSVKAIYKKRKEDTNRFAEKILSGRRSYKPLFEMVFDLLVLPIAVAYYLAGRFVLTKTFVASSRCTGCGLCVKKCPVNAIKIVDGRCFWTLSCESCMCCMNICPERAIETAHGFIAVCAVVFYLWILKLFYGFTGIVISNVLLRMAVGTILFFVFVSISYLIIHLLMRFPFFEKIIAYTSLTRYKFWRRYRPLDEE